MFEPAKKRPVLSISMLRESVRVLSSRGHFVKGLFFFMVLIMWTCGLPGAVFSDESQNVIFERSELTIVTATGRHHFRIELAKSRAARMRGLMERRHMDDDAGMLFDYSKPKPIHMWMKNTFIPLDMLFIDISGKIVRIVANTTPFSTDVIASPGPVLAVLELNGGMAARLAIMTGDKVIHDIFQP
jgi:uncharacterized protein